jgi:hypothetical protein
MTLQLVQDQLLGFLTPKDLASDELQLPLLAALGQAAQGGGWGGAVQPLSVLLAACCPSSRCLDTLASSIQVGCGNLTCIMLILCIQGAQCVCGCAAGCMLPQCQVFGHTGEQHTGGRCVLRFSNLRTEEPRLRQAFLL